MRLLAHIIAFVVLALSCFPCADDARLAEGKVQSELAEAHNDAGDQDHNDICPPFCHCSCCPGFSIVHIAASLNHINFELNKTFTAYLPHNLQQVSLPIWQPPQLV